MKWYIVLVSIPGIIFSLALYWKSWKMMSLQMEKYKREMSKKDKEYAFYKEFYEESLKNSLEDIHQ